MAAIEFRNVSKIFSRTSGRKLIRSHLRNWFSRSEHKEPFHALRDVSFSIDHCEGVAVLGPNGAGKSTLLSLVAGITCPDRGELETNGRVAALLQLGHGFHPDLTGVENVYLNASLIGLSKKRTEELFDSIVEFSGVSDFINEPLRTYSSGMTMRLAFAIAVNLDPDILILDEVMAVGDQNFQQKCTEKIMEFRHVGKTMLCVSHSIPSLAQLCNRAIWLDQGQLIMDGKFDEVAAAYMGRCALAAKA